MQEVDYLKQLARAHKDINSVQEVMAKNIDAALSCREKQEEIKEKDSHLQGIANQFNKEILK
jgi:Synaptobrevin